MSIEERRALLGDIEPTQVRESSNARVAIVFALLAAGGIGASAWLWTRLDSERESLRETEAKLAAESAARAAESADAARRLSAAEADLGAARASAKEAEEARIRNEKAADALIASFLRSSQVELGGSSTGLAREILRGGGLVHQINRRRTGREPRQMHAHLFTAGELSGIAIGERGET